MNRAATPSRWTGTITLAPMGAIFRGTGGDTPEHRHLAHKIVMGATAVGPSEGLRPAGDPIAVPAGARHRVLAAQRRVVLVYLDARRFRWCDAQRLAAAWGRVTPDVAVDALLDELGRASAWAADRRALTAIEAMARGDTLVEASRDLGLSESRVTHLVTEELGSPPRTWRTWLRLRSAIDLLGEGATITSAAHAAGFADSAHFSRTCMTSLGIPPSTLRNTWIDHARVGRCTLDGDARRS